MQKIATNMLIGNKSEPYMEYALLSTKFVDEKVIVNTGDKNSENIKKVKKIVPDAKIIQFTGEFNFSAARNLALNNTESQYILYQDMDEVHFGEFEEIARQCVTFDSYDGINFGFFHFIFDMFHFQTVDPRVILFKKHGKKWVGDVHEHVEPLVNVFNHPYRYHHYGYVKPQKEIYENWRLYWKLNPDENFKLNENRNPDDIITDRVSVAYDYTGTYPEAINEFVKTQTPIVKDFNFI